MQKSSEIPCSCSGPCAQGGIRLPRSEVQCDRCVESCVKICRNETDQWYVKRFDKGSLQCSGKKALGNNSGTRHREVYVCFALDQGGYQIWDFQALSIDMSSQIHDRSDRDRNLLSDILEKLDWRIVDVTWSAHVWDYWASPWGWVEDNAGNRRGWPRQILCKVRIPSFCNRTPGTVHESQLVFLWAEDTMLS